MIFFIIALLINLFFWYYIIVFCGIYNKSGPAWIFGAILSLIINWGILSFIIPLFLALMRSLAKKIGFFV